VALASAGPDAARRERLNSERIARATGDGTNGEDPPEALAPAGTDFLGLGALLDLEALRGDVFVKSLVRSTLAAVEVTTHERYVETRRRDARQADRPIRSSDRSS